jgi:hypothetical protein
MLSENILSALGVDFADNGNDTFIFTWRRKSGWEIMALLPIYFFFWSQFSPKWLPLKYKDQLLLF